MGAHRHPGLENSFNPVQVIRLQDQAELCVHSYVMDPFNSLVRPVVTALHKIMQIQKM